MSIMGIGCAFANVVRSNEKDIAVVFIMHPCICVCNAGIFGCRQCVPKAFGRTAIRLVFS
jgi:hypothetical protein